MAIFVAIAVSLVAGFILGALFGPPLKAEAIKVEGVVSGDYAKINARVKKAASDLGPGGTQPPPPAA